MSFETDQLVMKLSTSNKARKKCQVIEEHHKYYTSYERPWHLAKFVSVAKNDEWDYGMRDVEEVTLVRTYQRKPPSKIRTRYKQRSTRNLMFTITMITITNLQSMSHGYHDVE